VTSYAVSVSKFLYTRILRWYPPALKSEFGEDMAEVFTESIEASWQRGSWNGFTRAWLAVSHDLISILVPYRIACTTPIVLAVVAAVLSYGSALLAIDPSRNCHK